jgi:outer membrane biosynthesis protein TonB
VKKVLKFVLIVAFVFGGWALAAASLHVVRAPGKMCWGYIPANIQIVPKNALSFRETWVDTTKWSSADVANLATFVDRLHQANKMELVKEAMDRPSPADTTASAVPQRNAPAVSTEPTPTPVPAAPAAPAQKSIFDFSK